MRVEEELKSISFELGEEKEEMEKQLYKASTATESLNVAEAKVAELEKVVEDLKFEVEEAEKQREAKKSKVVGGGQRVTGASSSRTPRTTMSPSRPAGRQTAQQQEQGVRSGATVSVV